MAHFKFALSLMLAGSLLAAGCDKDKSSSTGTAQTSGTTATPAGTDAAAPTVNELVATYNAVSDVEGQSNMRRHQALVLNADGTADLTTAITNSAKPAGAPKSTDTATGTYTLKGKELVVVFSTKDGKPLPASDTMRTMKLTAGKADKSLLGDDGRTFERAK